MSNPYEPEMTKAYWAKRSENGTLYLEYPIHGRRIDGLVVLDDGNTSKAAKPGNEAPKLAELVGKRLIVIQTKRNKLGMGVAGQTIISKAMLEEEGISQVEAVALCLRIDEKILAAMRKQGCHAVAVDDSGRKSSKR
jgi:hypothetical protein